MTSLTLYEHPFASYCWKALVALYERDVPFVREQIDDEADRARLAELWPMASMPVLLDGRPGSHCRSCLGTGHRTPGRCGLCASPPWLERAGSRAL